MPQIVNTAPRRVLWASKVSRDDVFPRDYVSLRRASPRRTIEPTISLIVLFFKRLHSASPSPKGPSKPTIYIVSFVVALLLASSISLSHRFHAPYFLAATISQQTHFKVFLRDAKKSAYVCPCACVRACAVIRNTIWTTSHHTASGFQKHSTQPRQ